MFANMSRSLTTIIVALKVGRSSCAFLGVDSINFLTPKMQRPRPRSLRELYWSVGERGEGPLLERVAVSGAGRRRRRQGGGGGGEAAAQPSLTYDLHAETSLVATRPRDDQ